MCIVYIITNLGQLDIHLTLCIISKSEYVVYNGCAIYYLTSLLVVTFIYYCYYNKYNNPIMHFFVLGETGGMC